MELFSMVAYWMVHDHSISNHLITKQVKVPYSDKFAIQMFAIQIPTEHVSINACNRLAV